MFKGLSKGIILYLCVDGHDKSKFEETVMKLGRSKINYKTINEPKTAKIFDKTVCTYTDTKLK